MQVALCRIGKELLSKSTEASYLYMIRMKQKIVVISVRKLKCVKKSSFLLMLAMERLCLLKRAITSFCLHHSLTLNCFWCFK